MKRLVWALASVLLVGAPTPSAAGDFEKWEKEIQGIETRVQAQAPAPGGVLFVGSSSIRLWAVEKHFPGRGIINAGFGGSQIPDSTHFAKRLIFPWKPATVVLYAGDNDISAGRTPEQVAADFIDFASTVHASLPGSRIVFLSIKLCESRWKLRPRVLAANEMIRRFCEAADPARLTFVDLASPLLGADGRPDPRYFQKDQLHLSEAGYAVWTQALQPLLFPAQ